jgi:hypothetical protein
MNQVEPTVPAITTLLRSKGQHTIGHETNLSRSPLWRTRQRTASEETVVSPLLYGHAFRQVEGRPLTTGDQRLFTHLTTAFVRDGCPTDRRVPFSLGAAALALGYEDVGGKQRALIRGSLARLRSVTIESAVRHADGHETVLGWGLIDSYLVTTSGGGKGWIVLSELVSLLLTEGSVTFLHEPTWKAICSEDEVAGRLWSFLESENIGRGWRYQIFASDNNGQRSVPPIAELMLLNWSSRPEIAKRIRRACTVIEKLDSRYKLLVATGANLGSWVLTCSRGVERRPSRTIGVELPTTIIQAWRKAYRSHLPSQRQRAILLELITRHTAEWIADILAEPSQGDPFHYLLNQDRQVSDQRLAAAREAEEVWEGEKRRQSSEAEQSLADLIAEVTGRSTTA